MTTATLPESGIRRRYFPLRYDGERTIDGTALVYGDVAEFPWGDKERFEAGAFGSVASLDVILNVQHDRGKPVARTGGGGLNLIDSAQGLDIRAELPDTTNANDALTNIQQRIYRGLSIEFRPLKHRLEGTLEKGYTVVIEKAELRGVAIVDRPAYKKSLLREEDMDAKDFIKLMNDTLDEREEKARQAAAVAALPDTNTPPTIDTKALQDAVRAVFDETVKPSLDTIETRLASLEGEDPEDGDGDDDRMKGGKMKKKAKDDPPDDDMEGKGKRSQEEIEAEAEARAELLTRFASLLPTDFEKDGKDRHAILVAAAGDEVEDAENRSADYLEAKVEAILERREAAQNQPTGTNGNGNGLANMGDGPVNLVRFMEAQHLKRASAK